jgi:zinc transport system substrate-binding protein
MYMPKSFTKFTVGLIIIIAIVAGFSLWRAHRQQTVTKNTPAATSKLAVTASFYPLAEFAQQIGQDKVTVTNLVPAGAEPHDFEPSPQDIVTMQNSQVFIYNGAGLESWIDKELPDLQQHNVAIAKASQGITLLSGIPEDSDAVNPSPDASLADPHIWMDPALAMQEVGTIRDALMKADPTNKDFYQTNADKYTQQLQALNTVFTQGLAKCSEHNIVTSHAAFAYLARHYNLTMIPIAGLSPDSEPSPQRLANIADFAKQNHIHYIFFETLVSPKFSQTIATETGAKTIAFNPLEGLTKDQIDQGLNYIAVQQQNLANLKRALSCQ